MNRALILQSYDPSFEIAGHSDCEDVQKMQEACRTLKDTNHRDHSFQLGEGGTTLRFFLTRLSRLQGEFQVECHSRLLERPHKPLLSALDQLGVQVTPTSQGFVLKSNGWKIPKVVELDSSKSSQFLSALLINSWNLTDDLVLAHKGTIASSSYLRMTISFLKSMGMEVVETPEGLKVGKGQLPLRKKYVVEPDMSSCFALACFAALLGDLDLHNFTKDSLQPDLIFLEIFQEMGIPFQVSESRLVIRKTSAFKGVSWNLVKTPDLFPVLSVLLSQAQGKSVLSGLEALAHKESHRLHKSMELLKMMGIQCSVDGANFTIAGRGREQALPKNALQSFSPDFDHRMVMAGTLASHLGFPIAVLDSHMVAKSFPRFLDIVGAS